MHFCFDWDLFRRARKCEGEWDRRALLARPKEWFFASAGVRQQWEHQEQHSFVVLLARLKANANALPGSMAAAIVDWASLTRFITLSSSLAAACGVSSGGFTMALLEWLTLKDIKNKYAVEFIWHSTNTSLSLNSKDILQGSVSKHDSVEGESSGNRVLLNKLYEGEARWLGLVSSHSHKLDIPHLPEEVHQLLCCGGLRRGELKNLKIKTLQVQNGNLGCVRQAILMDPL